ncbi:MAG: GNAT family N-acetyltransferase [Nocardioidaceae bacterium]
MESDLEVTVVDVSDEAAFAEFHRVLTVADSTGRAYSTPTGLDEMRVGFRPDNTEWRASAVVASRRGQVVGALNLELPLRDNTHLLEVHVGVLPEHRRRGVGRALFDHALQTARATGRRSIYAQVVEPVGSSSPGAGFAAACGLSRELVELHQVLDLPLDDAVLASLRAAADHAERDGYRIATWQDRCPEEYAEGYCRLLSVFLEHVPIGGLDLEPEVWDVARLRATEARRLAQRRTAYRAVALDASGGVVGGTDLLAPADPSPLVYQGATLVLTEHRGHRLGVALKLANLRALQQRQSERRTVHTYNAPDNRPMIAVNEQLGFRSVEQSSDWQLTVS